MAVSLLSLLGPFRYSVSLGRAKKKQKEKSLFVMDNNPSQTGKRARKAPAEIEAELHTLPPHCTDIHCIENLFNQIKCYLDEEAVTQ